ncbi:MAG: hypothetical protein V1709_11040 [Planctomycetota bacterium]
MKQNKKAYYATIGLVLISGLTFVTGCSSTDKKPIPPPVTEIKQPVKEQPSPTTAPEKGAVQINTTKQITPLPSDAKGSLQQAVQNTLNVKSYAATMTMNTEIMGMNMSFDFDIKKCDNVLYESGTIMGMDFEIYSDLGNKVIALKDPRTQTWRRQSAEQDNLMFSFEQMQRKLYLEYIKDACLKGEERVGEKNCDVIEATVNPEDLQEILMNKKDLPVEFGGFSFDKVLLKVWVSKDDGFVYKTSASIGGTLSMEMPAGFLGEDEKDIDIEDENDPVTPTDKGEFSSGKQIMKFKYEIEMAFSDYNRLEPIIIPPDVKNVMENIKDDKTPEDKNELEEKDIDRK